LRSNDLVRIPAARSCPNAIGRTPRARLLAVLLLAGMATGMATDSAGAAESRAWRGGVGYRTYVIGNEQGAAPGAVAGGLLLSGGGDWPYEAFRWFAAKAGHGHIVVLAASGSTESQEEIYRDVGGVLSVRSFVFSDRKAAYDARVLAAIRAADGLFIAGGDQSRYVRFWRGTPVNELLDAHVAAGKPLGGTSAGLAMLGAWLYGCMDGGSITAPEALRDPIGDAVTLESGFLHLPLLEHVLTDSHFDTRARLGRLVAFLAKAHVLEPQRPLAGLGVDEQAALVVEPDGSARLYAREPGKHAWLVQPGAFGTPMRGQPLELPDLRVTGIDADSRYNVATGVIERAAFTRTYDAKGGVLSQRPRWSLALHGGAGVMTREEMTPALDAAYRAALRAALAAGQEVLEHGGSALDATQAALVVLEDSPLFNAGRGAAIAADGRIYLDAAIMDGHGQRAGAVAALTRTRNPVLAARAVMEHTRHVLLAGEGADAFSLEQGLQQEDPAWFRTPEREQMFRDWRLHGSVLPNRLHLYGTVGAVALDNDGHLAAATSTGGLTGKKWGRIGDAPLVGAGTFASDGVCAVSATGTGEYFIRDSAGRQVCDRVRWNHEGIAAAADDTIRSIGAIGGDGGLIAMDAQGQPAFAINDLGMYRAAISSTQPVRRTAIYADEVNP